MSKQYTIKVSIGVIGVNHLKGEYNVLSLEQDNVILPVSELDTDITIDNMLRFLSLNYVDLDPNWIEYSFLEPIIYEDNILIIYRGIIPYDTLLKDSYWIPVWKCTNSPLIPILLKSL